VRHPSLNMRWLVPRLTSFHAVHPWCQVVFKPYWKDDDMKREDIDAWIQTGATSTRRWPRHIQASYIIGREIVPICHPSVADRIRRPADLLKFPLLHHTNYPANWALWPLAQGLDTRSLRLADGFDLGAVLVEAVAGRVGVALLQLCLFERELAEGRVAMPLRLPVSTGRGYYLCVSRSAIETAALAAFRDWGWTAPVRRPPDSARASPRPWLQTRRQGGLDVLRQRGDAFDDSRPSIEPTDRERPRYWVWQLVLPDVEDYFGPTFDECQG
jgi:DNA-binding transcriptional LysR family regulator